MFPPDCPVSEQDPDMRRRYGIDKSMTVEEHVVLLIEQKHK
ncbi:MAG: hypothetical protein ACRD6I_17250 [Candidatus Acidiferrales bacterium]